MKNLFNFITGKFWPSIRYEQRGQIAGVGTQGFMLNPRSWMEKELSRGRAETAQKLYYVALLHPAGLHQSVHPVGHDQAMASQASQTPAAQQAEDEGPRQTSLDEKKHSF